MRCNEELFRLQPSGYSKAVQLGHWICMAEFKISGNLNNQMNTINETRHMAVILTTNTFFSVRILMYLTQYLLYLT